MNQQLNPLSLSGKNSFLANPKKNGFTLVELIIVVIIVGILASLGLTQYSLMVEKSRLAEAKVRIGVMRDMAYSYYLENGSLTSIQSSDVGADITTCTSANYYSYQIGGATTSTMASLASVRCTSGGKSPNGSREYVFKMYFYPSTGQSTWYCYYTSDTSSCFGYPAGP